MRSGYYLWVRLSDEQGNCDQLPGVLCPKTGCPECGSAWTEVTQVACAGECTRGFFDSAHWFIRQIGEQEPVLAVRLGCGNGHIVEYDGFTMTVIPPPPLPWGQPPISLNWLVAVGYTHAIFAAHR